MAKVSFEILISKRHLSDPMRCAVVVTGASRGFGRCLALDFARELATSDLDLFLWARNKGGLKETSRLVQQVHGSTQQAEELRIFIETATVPNIPRKWTVLHNAEALGALGFAQECPSPSEMTRHFELNVTSVMWLNKRFLDVFGASRSGILSPLETRNRTKLVIMNISSRAAIAPYPTLSQYCTAKAAREMHFRVLAMERMACNKVQVFSYSPGAMDTDMQQTMRESPLLAPELAKWFMEMKEQGTLVPTQQLSHRGPLMETLSQAKTSRLMTSTTSTIYEQK